MERLPTPLCEISNLPLPVLPLEPRSFGALFVSRETNMHHHFHPASSPYLSDGAGKALRTSRVQRLPVKTHNEYHRYYDGPPLCDDESIVFRSVVLAAAGVVPRQALDVRSPGKVVGLNYASHRKIVEATRIDRVQTVSHFLADYCAQQEIDCRIIDELTDDQTSHEARIQIARDVLRDSIDTALGSLIDEHSNIVKERMTALTKSPTLYSVTRTLIRRHALNTFASKLATYNTPV